MKQKYLPSSAIDPRLCLGLESLFSLRQNARKFTLEEFYALSAGHAMPTGNLVYEVDGGYPLILNDRYETAFLDLLCRSGFASSIRGQNKEIDYIKPWASTPSPYYPDFMFRTYDGRIALVEIKSILGMAQDENIVKRSALYAYCQQNGFLFAFLDAEKVSFDDYLSPVEDCPEKRFFLQTVLSIGGFTNRDLEPLERTFPKKEKKDLKRLVSSLILQDPYLLNRYCHDSPDLVNAVKVPTLLTYKCFRYV
jgi:hypothetical protein